MQLEGWKCLECGTVYAPFVKECRCSVKITSNVQLPVCFHTYINEKCTKCGMIMTRITFDSPEPPVPCPHVYPENMTTTAGRICSLCGVQEVLWERSRTIGGITNG